MGKVNHKAKLYLFRAKKIIESQACVDLLADYTESDMKVIDEIDSAMYNLQELEKERQNNIIELFNTGKTEYNFNLWKKELISKYRLFIIMLGIVDSKIENNIKDKKIVCELINFREFIIEKYSEYNTIKVNKEVDKSILEIISTKLYYNEGFENSNGYTKIAHKFYKYGYNISNDISMDLIMNYYKLFLGNTSKSKESIKTYSKK